MAISGQGCTTQCWGLAAVIGALTFLATLTVGGMSFVAALFLGVLAAVLLGFLFTWLFCSDGRDSTASPAAPPVAEPTSAAAASGSATSAGAAGAASAVGAAAAGTALAGDGATRDAEEAKAPPAKADVPADQTAPAEQAPADVTPDAPASADQSGSRVKPSTPLAGEEDLDSRKGSWKYEASADPTPNADPAPVAEPTADAAPAPDEAPAAKPAADAESAGNLVKPSKALAGQQELAGRKGTWRYEGASERSDATQAVADTIPDYDKDGVLEGTEEGAKPTMLDGPRDGGADNLKEIKGIGPKLEVLCHSLGVYHFDQIAQWSADEVAWMDANLEGFRGRVSRDDWVAQAKVLSEGGDTDFSRRVDGGDVY